MGVVFIAGTYGVGKSTLGDKLCALTKIPFYSAGDLISGYNGEFYKINKYVKDKESNQNILIDAVEKELEISKKIFLTGHFCIFDKSNRVETLPLFVFERLHIEKIVLLETSVDRIKSNILQRDSKEYSAESIGNLIEQENKQANLISNKLNIPLYKHFMKYDGSDVDNVLKHIEGI